ncbi:MAG: hypothetical protein JSU96_10000 [Acidobacteriota bacterium]|nr:MAG: hypothetical protein JSU96_10000 [Acidobacteriota bacterium]
MSRYIAVFSAHPTELFEFAHLLAPKVEHCPPDGLILEIPVRYEQDTLNRLSQFIGNHSVQIGGASTRTAAILAAKNRPGTLIPHGKETQFLSALPLASLTTYVEIDQQTLATFSQWGIQTLGELGALPENALISRLGQKGLLLQKIARGEDTDLFAPYTPPVEFEERQQLEWALNNLEPLAFILGGMLESVCSKLRAHGLAMEEIELRLCLVDSTWFTRSIRLALPMQDPKVILSLVRLDLQSHPPQTGITEIAVKARPTRPRFFQHSLLHPTAPSPEKLSKTLTRLKSLVGDDNVGSPILLDTHRPDAVELRELDLSSRSRRTKQGRARTGVSIPGQEASSPESAGRKAPLQLSLRRLRPAQVTRINPQEIITCAGPWKSSGDWWTDEEQIDGWSREEWDVEMVDGGIYRIYWDNRSRQWFLEGIYD